MAQILDQFGRPIEREVLAQPQTARIATLENTFIRSSVDGLTPARAAGLLRAADAGDLMGQHELFDDMMDRDAHLACEFGKRRGAVLGLDWDIVPPRNASAAETAAAEWVEEVLRVVADDLDDALASLMDGVGYGFSAVELEWYRDGGDWLPRFHPRPHTWFRLSQDRRELRLNDVSADGAPLWPFGWLLHQPGKVRTGYLSRAGLLRVLVWPFLYRAYAIGDFAEFLETYGLPIVVGKFGAMASPDEKAALLRAVTALGHDARAIMPQDMEMDIKQASAGGSKDSVHLAMVAWAEGAISKAVLGQVLSTEAKGTGMGSGVAELHREVRHDILTSDTRQLANTLTRDLVYPLIALNRGGVDGLRRCPRLVFDTGEAEDLQLYADALPKLAGAGLQVPVSWAQEKLRIPLPEGNEAVMRGAPAPVAGGGLDQPGPAPSGGEQRTGTTALAALPAAGDGVHPGDALADSLAAAAAPAMAALLAHVQRIVDQADSLAALRESLLDAYGSLETGELARVMALGFATADLAGRFDSQAESLAAQNTAQSQ